MRMQLRILVVEDSEDDALLVLHHIRAGGYDIEHERVETSEAMQAALHGAQWDIVLSDFKLPHFNGLEALRLVKEFDVDIPFIIISGTIGEEIAVEAMQAGAHDYIMKNNLTRLLPAIERELRESKSRVQRKLLERKQEESEARLRLQSMALESAANSIAISDKDGAIIWANHALCDLTGYAMEEIIGQNPRLFKSDVQEPGFYHALWNTILSGSVWHDEIVNRRKDGTLYMEEMTITPVYNQEGKITNFIAIKQDITERKHAEQRLIQSESRLHEAQRLAHIGNWELDLTSDAFICSDEICTMFEFDLSRANAKYERFRGAIHREDREMVIAVYTASVRNNTPYSIDHRLWFPDGRIKYVQEQGKTSYAKDGSPLRSVGTVQDITERKMAEEALKQSEERYRNLFNEDLTGDYVVLPNGTLIACNSAFVRIFGFSSIEEALHTNIAGVYKSPEEQRDIIRMVCERRKIEYYEHALRRKDGSTVYVVENVIGKFNSTGDLIEIQGYVFDDTERKILQQQFIQVQKMESLGVLAGGIAHDFNNVLGIILAYASKLQMGKQTTEQVTRALAVIVDAVERGAGLVKQILTFARKADVVYGVVDANVMIKELAKLLTETLPKTIRVITELDENIPSVTVDTTQFHQALLNLCVNARDAMPTGGTLKMRTHLLSHAEVMALIPQASDEKYLRISVSDTGIGMDDATKERIFEPFFTTKEKGKGTGLGLAVVYGIVKSHKGYVTLDSTLGRGSTFHLFFPVSTSPSKAIEDAKYPVEEIKGGDETILVVEDEGPLVSFLKSMLEAKGYSVLTAMDGIDALDMYHRHKDEIDLVVSDMGLPRLSGDKIYYQLQEMDPALKVILASGYIEPEKKSELLKSGAKEFIQKPYLPFDVLMKIRKVLDVS
ncbi:MAG TPA: PAS domain S-box protein [Bacteroidota bacterium]|nr:PAS domain S-box protein [Bacteroidota bacterium]